MIAKLTGTVDGVGADHLVLDVGGVGYRVFSSRRTLAGAQGACSLLIHTHVREDALTLYGFATAAEQGWFERLTGVQGVGAKAALAILSALDPDALALAIMAGDEAPLRRADGIGPKIARRIVTELKDKAPLPALAPASPGAPAPSGESTAAVAEAVSALTNLGYGRAEAYGAVTKAGESKDAAALIRSALKELGGAL